MIKIHIERETYRNQDYKSDQINPEITIHLKYEILPIKLGPIMGKYFDNQQEDCKIRSFSFIFNFFFKNDKNLAQK